MKITSLSVQARDKNRVNVSVDGAYRFSLDITQVADLGLKIGKEYSEDELTELEQESQFGKLYTRTLEYVLTRPRSKREVRDYLYRKTRATKYKSRATGEIKDREGVSIALTERVFDRLEQKNYLNDESFARFWVENRNLSKGVSQRKLSAELSAKGVERGLIDKVLEETERDDGSELQKIIAKKAKRYDDPQKLMAYLARLGFSYDDIKEALDNRED